MNMPRQMHNNEVLTINDLCEMVNTWATSKGWNEGEDSVMRKSSDIALMHSELSECLEFVRKKVARQCPQCLSNNITLTGDYGGNKHWKCNSCLERFSSPVESHAMDDHVPTLTGEAAELADVLIRIFHYCGRRGINLGEAVKLKHEYNITRPYKHGKQL